MHNIILFDIAAVGNDTNCRVHMVIFYKRNV